MKIKLINIGRNHYSGETEVKDLNKALEEVMKHLLSSNVNLVESKKKNFFNVFAGFHIVGQVEIIENK